MSLKKQVGWISFYFITQRGPVRENKVLLHRPKEQLLGLQTQFIQIKTHFDTHRDTWNIDEVSIRLESIFVCVESMEQIVNRTNSASAFKGRWAHNSEWINQINLYVALQRASIFPAGVMSINQMDDRWTSQPTQWVAPTGRLSYPSEVLVDTPLRDFTIWSGFGIAFNGQSISHLVVRKGTFK